MRRRDFIVGLGGAVAWPLAARAQQGVRRVGVLLPGTGRNGAVVPKALTDGLAKLGWIEGRSLKLDFRYGAGQTDLFHSYAAELVSLKPDVIVTVGLAATKAVQQQTQTIPIVFMTGGDPVIAGILKSVARPEGNTTGITEGLSSIGGKCLQLLKEAAPRIERVADLYNPQNPIDDDFSASIEEGARSLGLQVTRIPFHDAVEFERAIEVLAAAPNGGVIVETGVLTVYPPPLFFGLMVKHRLPDIHQASRYITAGGLMSYGPKFDEAFETRGFAQIDRILRGAKVSDLPVEYPTKFELTVNLKTAKAIGLAIPESFLLRADELIE